MTGTSPQIQAILLGHTKSLRHKMLPIMLMVVLIINTTQPIKRFLLIFQFQFGREMDAVVTAVTHTGSADTNLIRKRL